MINVVNYPSVSATNIEAYHVRSKHQKCESDDGNLSMRKFYLLILACFWIIVILIAIVFLFIYGISNRKYNNSLF